MLKFFVGVTVLLLIMMMGGDKGEKYNRAFYVSLLVTALVYLLK